MFLQVFPLNAFIVMLNVFSQNTVVLLKMLYCELVYSQHGLNQQAYRHVSIVRQTERQFVCDLNCQVNNYFFLNQIKFSKMFLVQEFYR